MYRSHSMRNPLHYNTPSTPSNLMGALHVLNTTVCIPLPQALEPADPSTPIQRGISTLSPPNKSPTLPKRRQRNPIRNHRTIKLLRLLPVVVCCTTPPLLASERACIVSLSVAVAPPPSAWRRVMAIDIVCLVVYHRVAHYSRLIMGHTSPYLLCLRP